jgi:hypothetical protein
MYFWLLEQLDYSTMSNLLQRLLLNPADFHACISGMKMFE